MKESFNGAGAECSGNRVAVQQSLYGVFMLQWGRSGMLRKPLQKVRKFEHVRTWLQWGRSGMLRKPAKGLSETRAAMKASMGPERNAPETTDLPIWIYRKRFSLQWGRSGMLRKPPVRRTLPGTVLTSFNGAGAECSGNQNLRFPVQHVQPHASMGPERNAPETKSATSESSFQYFASMGPERNAPETSMSILF